MYLTREAIKAAKFVTLPEQEHIFEMTEWDKRVWQKAFDWYNEYLNKNPEPVNLTCKKCYHTIFTALKRAKEFLPRENQI